MFNNDVQNKFQYFAYIKKSCIYLVMISAVIQYIHAPMGLCPKNVYKPMTNRGSIYINIYVQFGLACLYWKLRSKASKA